MTVDLAASCGLLFIPVVAVVAYLVRVASRGSARSDRVEREQREGTSSLLSKGAMEMFYWALGPFARACLILGISANAVTFASLVLGVAGAVAVAAGHLGLGALLAATGAIGDALDGIVAKASGTASEAGEVLDAAVDRYTELALLGGIAVHFRADAAVLVLVLAAIAGSFMISYSTAKAEALRVTPPRGSMRRSERAVLVVGGCMLTPIADLTFPAMHEAPLVSALVIVAVIGNASAIRRLRAIAHAVDGAAVGVPEDAEKDAS